MQTEFNLDIRSPEKTLFKGKAVSVTVPAEFGYMGILANHVSLITNLTKGKIAIKDNSENTKEFVIDKDGVMEVLKNNVEVIIG